MANVIGVTYDENGRATYIYDDGSSSTYDPSAGNTPVESRGPTGTPDSGYKSAYVPPKEPTTNVPKYIPPSGSFDHTDVKGLRQIGGNEPRPIREGTEPQPNRKPGDKVVTIPTGGIVIADIKFRKENHVLKDGTGIPNDQWEKLDLKYQKIADSQGFDAMQRAIENDFKANYHILKDGTGIPKEAWDNLDKKYQDIADKQGYDAMNKAIESDYQASIAQNVEFYRKAGEESKQIVQDSITQQKALDDIQQYKVSEPMQGPLLPGQQRPIIEQGYDINSYLLASKSPGEAFKTLRTAGFSWEDIQKATKQNVQLAQEAHKAVEEQYSKAGVAKYAGTLAADMLVPGYYTATNWDNMGAGEKALSISLDVLTIIPFAKAAGMGAREVATSGRIARLAGAGKGVLREGVAQLRAPVDMVAHPVATVKGTAGSIRDLGETLLHPSKIPQAVLTTSSHTVKLRVSETTSPEQAMKIRDKLMDLVRKGEKPIVEVNGTQYELSRSPFMKEVGGGLAHATPGGEVFQKGITVEPKPGLPEREQGLFMANEPLPRFAQSSALGISKGEKPAFVIVSSDTAKKAVYSQKLYAGKAEMELKFPVGTKLPEPKQKLFTRIGMNNTRVEIYLEKPLSKFQIAKLKSLGLIEDIKAPFKPAIDVSGEMAGLDSKGVKQLAKSLEKSGNRDVADVLRRSESDILRAGNRSATTTGRAFRTTRTGERIVEPSRITRGREATRATGERPGLRRTDQTRTTERITTARTEPTRIEPARIIPERVTPGRTPDRGQPERIPPGGGPGRVPPRDEPTRVPPGGGPGRIPPRGGEDHEIKLPRPPLPKLKSEQKQVKEAKMEPGAWAFQQGMLEVDPSHAGPERVYYYANPPDYVVRHTIGKPPEGFKEKGRTPQESFQVRGRVTRRQSINMGITTAHASPENSQVRFTRNITEKAPRISGRGVRISPRFSRLR